MCIRDSITADEMLSGIEPQRETKTQQAKDLIDVYKRQRLMLLILLT